MSAESLTLVKKMISEASSILNASLKSNYQSTRIQADASVTLMWFLMIKKSIKRLSKSITLVWDLGILIFSLLRVKRKYKIRTFQCLSDVESFSSKICHTISEKNSFEKNFHLVESLQMSEWSTIPSIKISKVSLTLTSETLEVSRRLSASITGRNSEEDL